MNEGKLKDTLNKNPTVKPEIIDWQNENSQLDENLHVKYNPSEKNSNNHLASILADVNENSIQIEEHLNKEFELKKLATSNLDFLGDLADIGLGLNFLGKDNAEKEKKHREDLKRERENLAHKNDGKII